MSLLTQINWDNYQNLKIINVEEKLREKVKKIMMDYFYSYELFKILKMQEEPDFKQDLQVILQHIFENDCSIAVIDKETNDIRAVALLKCMTTEWRSWTNLRVIIKSERFMELCELVRYCLKKEAKLNHDSSLKDGLHVFSFYIKEKELEMDKCFKARFFNVISEVARHMHMPRVTCMLLSRKNRDILQEQGFQEVVRIMYSMYLYKGRKPFNSLKDINEMNGSLYVKNVEPLTPYNELIIRHEKSEDPRDDKRIKKVNKKSD